MFIDGVGISCVDCAQILTGGDGAPSPRRSMQASSLMADFDDEDSDETEGSGESSSVTAPGATRASGVRSVASAVATVVSTAMRPRQSLASRNLMGGNGDSNGGGGGPYSTESRGRGGRSLADPAVLEDAYLQLTHSLAQHNQRAGRVRAAARCWGKRAELLLERGEVGIAQARLVRLADLYQVRVVCRMLPVWVAGWVVAFPGYGRDASRNAVRKQHMCDHRTAVCYGRQSSCFLSRPQDTISVSSAAYWQNADFFIALFVCLTAYVMLPFNITLAGSRAIAQFCCISCIRCLNVGCITCAESPPLVIFFRLCTGIFSGIVSQQSEGWLPQAFWTLHRLARCRRTIASSSTTNSGGCGGDGNASGSYVSTVMRLVALLRDPRVRSEGGSAAVNRAAAGLLRDAHALTLTTSPSRAAEDDSPYRPDTQSAEGGGAEPAYKLQCFADVKASVLVGCSEGDEKDRSWLWSPGELPTVHVGDTLRVSCILTSHLPEAVTLDSLALEMTYEGRYVGGRETDNGAHRRGSRTSMLPGGRRNLQRLESVKNMSGVDDSPIPPSPASRAPAAKFRPPPPVVTATSALTESLTDMDASFGPAAAAAAATADRELMAGQNFSKARSQSLSPRSKNPAAGNNFASVGGIGGGAVDARSVLALPDRSKSTTRYSIGDSPESSPRLAADGPTVIAPLSRAPRHQQRSPAVCGATIDGPTQLEPGENIVIFSLRPAMPGIVTATRISISWGGVHLVGVLPQGGRGAAVGATNPAAQLTVPVGAPRPRPAPSAVVRPFRPQATLEILPPAFLPAGCGGWMRVVVTTGPDTMRGTRLRVGVGHGLAWGSVALARIRLRPVGSDVGGGDDGEERQALATAREDLAEVAVELPDRMRAGWRADVFLRVLSTAPAAPRLEDLFVSSTFRSPTPKACTVKAEMQAGHSRDAEDAAAKTPLSPPGNDSQAGVECRIRARGIVQARLPFETRTTVMPRPGGVVLAEASLVCRAPVALVLRSCEIDELETGATVMANPNAHLDGELLPPGQPLRLAVCLRRDWRARVLATATEGFDGSKRTSIDSDFSSSGLPPPLAVLRLHYEIHHDGTEDDGTEDDGTPKTAANEDVSRENEKFIFDVTIPAPPERSESTVRSLPASITSVGTGSIPQPRVTLTAFVEPSDGGGSAKNVATGDGSMLELKLAEPRAFEFGVDVGSEAPDGAKAGAEQLATFQVAACPLDWMISGLVKGSAKLGTEVRSLLRVVV